jgi:TonB family protein
MADVWKKWEGQTVNGEFRLAAYLGGSENGAVFQADYGDREPRTAAIRLAFENSPNAEILLQWWQFASTLSHPNLIRIFQTGRCQIGDAKLIYVAMEFAEEDLSHVVPYRALTKDEAIGTLTPALDALAYLNTKGVVHGRIKPGNIMAIGEELKLSSDGLHRAGEPVAVPGAYDPPEGTRSAAGDVWSLGITLVEILTQRVPDWDRNGRSDPVVPETLPAPLLEIARHCLRRDPARRWTIAYIANRLNPPVAPPPMTASRAERPVQLPVQFDVAPTRTRYWIPAVILLLALSGYVGLKLLNRSTRGAVQSSQTTEATPAAAPATPAPEPQQPGSAAPSEEVPTPLNEKQSSGTASQVPVPSPTPPAEMPKAAGNDAASNVVVQQVLPDVPQKARDTIWGTVRVGIKVSVDPSGDVTDATIDSPGPSSYFANLALQAARQWKFAPAHDASSIRILRFEFTPNGAKAFAQASSP